MEDSKFEKSVKDGVVIEMRQSKFPLTFAKNAVLPALRIRIQSALTKLTLADKVKSSQI